MHFDICSAMTPPVGGGEGRVGLISLAPFCGQLSPSLLLRRPVSNNHIILIVPSRQKFAILIHSFVKQHLIS